MHRRAWALITATAIASIALFFFLRRPAPAPPPLAAPAVALAVVREGDYTVVLDEAGTVGAPAGTTAQLAFPNSGVLAHLFVRVGQHVTAGQALAALDTRALALDAEQAWAQAQEAAAGYGGGSVPQAALEAARDRARAARQRAQADRAEVARAQQLYAAGVSALKDVQSASAQLAADEASASSADADVRAAEAEPHVASAHVRAARARAQTARLLLAQGMLYAPESGIVTAILRRPGEAVDPSMPVVAVGPPQNEVTLRVPADDAARIAVGNPVSLRVAGSNQIAAASVSAIVPAVDPTTQTATVVVDGMPPGAVAGAAVRARITVAHVRGSIVPESAIVGDPQSGHDVVFVQERRKNGTTTFAQRIVHVAYEDGERADVDSGIRPGERIASQGAFQLLAPSGS